VTDLLPDRIDRRRGDGAGADDFDEMVAVAVKSDAPVGIDGEPHPRPPPETDRIVSVSVSVSVSVDARDFLDWLRAAREFIDWLDGHLQVDPGEPSQLVADECRLDRALCPETDVLKVAAAAPARPGVRAWRLDAVGRRLEDLDRIGS